MGIFDQLNKSKGSANPEGELRQLIVQVKDGVADMVRVMTDLPSDIREGSRSSYSETVGETPEGTIKRLTNMERRLLSGSLDSIPRSDIASLKNRMKRLDTHLISSQQQVKDLSEGRKEMKGTLKELSGRVHDLIKGLERSSR